MKDNYYKICPNCESTKPVVLFASNGWCKVCMNKYLKYYKAPRLDFEATLLSEEDMKNEMRSTLKYDPKGLDALSDLTEQFRKALKIKKFESSNPHKRGINNNFDIKALAQKQTNLY